MPLIIDNSSFTAVTYGQVEVTGLTLPNPSATTEWADTGINMPANSVIDYIMLELTTDGVQDAGKYWIANWGIGGTTYSLYNSDQVAPGGAGYWGIDLTNAYDMPAFYIGHGFGVMGIGHYQVLPYAGWPLHIKITTNTQQPETAAVVDLLVGYKQFATS